MHSKTTGRTCNVHYVLVAPQINSNDLGPSISLTSDNSYPHEIVNNSNVAETVTLPIYCALTIDLKNRVAFHQSQISIFRSHQQPDALASKSSSLNCND